MSKRSRPLVKRPNVETTKIRFAFLFFNSVATSIILSPDEGGTNRAVYLANVLGVDMGMFYKRRDNSTVINGKNPIVAHEFLGDDVTGKDVLIVDDMISSGESMLDVAKQLKERNAGRVFVCTTFGLFTDGFDKVLVGDM